MLPLLAPPIPLAVQAQTIKESDRGSALVRYCKYEIKREEESGDKLSTADLFLANNCFVYISGFGDGQDYAGLHICPPPDLTIGTLIRLYVNYMESHPLLLDKYKAVGLDAAIRTTLACMSK